MNRLEKLTDVLINSGVLTEQELKDITPGVDAVTGKRTPAKLKLVDSMKTIRFEVSGQANIIELLTDNTAVVNGVSDFSKKTLNTTGIYDRILVKSFEGLDANFDIKTATYSASASAFNKGLINSKVKIAHNYKKVLEAPVSAIISDAASTAAVSANLAYTLESPVAIAKGVDSDITLTVPESTTITPAALSSTFVEITLIGMELIAR